MSTFLIVGIVINLLMLFYIALRDDDFEPGYVLTAMIPYAYVVAAAISASRDE